MPTPEEAGLRTKGDLKLARIMPKQTKELVLLRLKNEIAAIEAGEYSPVRVLIVYQIPIDDDDATYRVKTSDLTNEQALWMLEMGRHALTS